MENFQTEVTKELSEMKKIGMHVPDMAFTLAANTEVMKEYDNMSVSECADLLIQLSYL